MKEIYLDNAATTPLAGEVSKAMEPYWSKTFGNPSSFNEAGREAKKAIDEARKKIARILGAKSNETIFTSSATEANNLAISGLTRALKSEIDRPHIITTKVEHPSVLKPAGQLEKEGIDITCLSVNKEGLINLNELKNAIRPNTVLVSIIYVNNEIGTIQPIKKIAKVIKESKARQQRPYLHIDASQAAGHVDMDVNNLGVDLMTISSHKIYGPKGVAALYVRKDTPIKPLSYGGGQEFDLRPSTESVPLIVGFAKAMEMSKKSRGKDTEKLENLRKYFVGELKKLIPGIKINSPKNPESRVPNIINVVFPGVENEQLLLHMDKYGIRASAGSACASHDIEPSHVLTAVGLSRKDARSSIRFSLGRQTRKEELNTLLKILPKIIEGVEKLYPGELKKYYYTKP